MSLPKSLPMSLSPNATQTLQSARFHPVAALIAMLATGCLWGVVSALLPLVKLAALVLILSILVLYLVSFRMTGPIVAVWFVAGLGSLGATAAMWLTWFALEHGATWAWQLVQMGPMAFYRAVEQIVSRSTVSVSFSSASPTRFGPDDLRWMWQAQTGAFLGAPLLGALANSISRRRAAVF